LGVPSIERKRTKIGEKQKVKEKAVHSMKGREQ
jgi:hypothetical protein